MRVHCLSIFIGEMAHRFIAEPEWQGRCCGTTPLTRVPQQLRQLLADISMPLVSTDSKIGQGLAQVEAARGRLVHRVEIDDRGIIQRYQILAPTEWNFHPRGLIPKGLANLRSRSDEELNQLAKIFINAVDSCVGYSLRIH